MADGRSSPTVRRRRLSARLRKLREDDGRSAKEIAEQLEWSPSKVTHIERNEWKLPSARDVRDLLDAYGITDERQREELTTLAKEGRNRGWWHPYREMLSERYSTYIGLEAEASTVLNYEPLMLPGLLQTPDTARALIRRGPAEIGEEEIEARVLVRMERIAALHGADPMRLVAVVDESALRREVGGPAVRRAQLQHLLEIAELPKVTLQVIPYAAGAHPGMSSGFAVLQFPEPEDFDAVYVETAAGELFVEEPEDVDRFNAAFLRLLGDAMSPADTITRVAELAAKA